MPPPRLLLPRRPPLTLLCRRFLPHPRFYSSNNTVTGEFQKSQKRSLKDVHHGHKEKRQDANIAFTESPWEVICGLEVHAQLNTERKLFSDATMSTTAPPNTHISVIDASLPGTQPTLNPKILLPALRAAVALSCKPEQISRFDRKHYFYWDQPAGYQITQFYQPLAKNGTLRLTKDADGMDLEVKIRQVQIEQDTGKTIAAPPNSLVDLNRVGAPLVEIITDPFPLAEAATAGKVLAKIQGLLKAVDACVLGMEWGGLRADVNVSVRRRGETELGRRCEIKNLSSFKAVTEAILSESQRQIAILSAGGTIGGETRGWDAEHFTTRRLRGKEGEVDYRYMPDPDLPPVVLTRRLIDKVKGNMPPLPDQIVEELTSKYGLTAKDARTILLWDDGRSGDVVAYYKSVVSLVTPNDKTTGKIVGNWMIHELGGLLTIHEISWAENKITAHGLAELISLLVGGKITGATAKALLPRLLTDRKASAAKIVQEENLAITEISDDELSVLIKGVLDTDEGKNVLQQLEANLENEKKRKGLRGFVVGKVMRSMGGKVKADRVDGLLSTMLSQSQSQSQSESQ
ncbi:GatB/GatE catalytic domain-containing protein [Tricharina praecox]|uniref:GatB/GatE catalytic domain-containing protein n=1 Tax=Tricharina praecox TaxID=43433 RepID=UPI0022205E1C|nr:GatB/GatE catalytic domain-containing protein [Tricharina praecox]KAI5855521.1 GatB/GatE catalytic domain-containing protein [Tricharina praecox]